MSYGNVEVVDNVESGKNDTTWGNTTRQAYYQNFATELLKMKHGVDFYTWTSGDDGVMFYKTMDELNAVLQTLKKIYTMRKDVEYHGLG